MFWCTSYINYVFTPLRNTFLAKNTEIEHFKVALAVELWRDSVPTLESQSY